VVDAQRRTRREDVGQLAPTVREAAEITSWGAVFEVDRDFRDRNAGANRVDRHSRLGAESGREREDGCTGSV
jgi:hypothetical protein